MSIGDDAVTVALTRLALAADGAFLGAALAYAAAGTLLKVKSTSTALRQIEAAPSVPVADLRSILPPEGGNDDAETLVIVRGVVDTAWNKRSGLTNFLVSHESGDKGVILHRTQTCIYHEWNLFFRCPYNARSLFSRKEQQSSSFMRTVPFVLADAGSWPKSKDVTVNMDGSRHPLPLVTVYRHLQPVTATPYRFIHALFGREYPVGLLDEEKILPLGKEITAVGFCSLKSGTPEIRSSNDLPYFLSDKGKDQMILDLAFERKVLLWAGVVIGTVAVGVLSYAAKRNWTKFKNWRERRQMRQQNTMEDNDPDAQTVSEDDSGEVPDGELCVICLTRRRRSAFVPCGHLVCCQRCALRVECEGDKKCPVCMQPFVKSVRIYSS